MYFVEILESPEFYDQLTSTIICKARELGKVIATKIAVRLYGVIY